MLLLFTDIIILSLFIAEIIPMYVLPISSSLYFTPFYLCLSGQLFCICTFFCPPLPPPLSSIYACFHLFLYFTTLLSTPPTLVSVCVNVFHPLPPSLPLPLLYCRFLLSSSPPPPSPFSVRCVLSFLPLFSLPLPSPLSAVCVSCYRYCPPNPLPRPRVLKRRGGGG